MTDTFHVEAVQDFPVKENFQSAAPKTSHKITTKKTTTKNTKSKTSRKSLKTQIGALLTLFNMTFFFLPDEFKGDALTEEEIDLLSDALNKQAQKSPMLHKYLNMIVSGGDSAQLMWVVGIIAAKRLVNHNLLPQQIGSAANMLMTMNPTDFMPTDDNTSLDV